jgi:hypothetical protein
MKLFWRRFACLLLVLLPLQSIAAANMLVCNSLMQLAQGQALTQTPAQANSMPCHDMGKKPDHQHQKSSKNCGVLCNSLCAVVAISDMPTMSIQLPTAQLIGLNAESYISITLPQLQRPPILLT